MKININMLAILALLILISGNKIFVDAGSEKVKGIRDGKLCGTRYRMENCNDTVCDSACKQKFPKPNEGGGFCAQDDNSICLCFRPCQFI
ncbi:hypothetical protein K1719_044158 [Acacia pycnantha]|nr:hypothetical protein K1719_044158 [Acacia pycnantha]